MRHVALFCETCEQLTAVARHYKYNEYVMQVKMMYDLSFRFHHLSCAAIYNLYIPTIFADVFPSPHLDLKCKVVKALFFFSFFFLTPPQT